MGTAIDRIYPSRNAGLAKRILDRGAILSEYSPGSETRAYYFQVRNRIISGLADALLVVEASRSSGTKGTYDFANKQGKDIFVVPGDLSRPMSVGANEMLREGAHPYLDVSDILIRFGKVVPPSPERDLSHLSSVEQRIYREIKDGNCLADNIVEKLDIGVVDFNQAITTLELEDLVVQNGAGWTICP